MTMLFQPGAIPSGPSFEAGKALLVMDFQNDFVSPDGKVHVPSSSIIVPKVPTLAAKFRAKGTVVWARTEYTQDRQTYVPELGANGILLKPSVQSVEEDVGDQGTTAHRRRRSTSQQLPAPRPHHDSEAFLCGQSTTEDIRPCLPGTWGAEYPAILSDAIDQSKDIDVVKTNYSAFADTSLLLTLRMRLITHIYVCGSLSNVSVYATVLDAVRHGIAVTLVEDMLGYRTESCHLAAIQQMVDNMGAAGIDYQELMDDLAGLLGDVIREEDFAARYQVSMSSAPPGQSLSQIKGQQPSSQKKHQSVEEWRAKIWPDVPKLTEAETEGDRSSQKAKRESPSAPDESSRAHKSKKLSSRQGTPDLSPPRKRSTSDFDNSGEDHPATSIRQSLSRPSPTQTRSAEGTRQRIQKPRVRRARPSQESSTRPKTPTPLAAICTQSTGDLPDPTTMAAIEAGSASASTPSPSQPRQERDPPGRKPKKHKSAAPVLGPSDTIGAGDSHLHTNILDSLLADQYFTSLRTNVQWQKMYHRTGEVPRLVAVQGQATSDGDIPIYRHPADESPELLPFDDTILKLKAAAEKVVGHQLNHVLIQWYRNGEDRISEHSDKTLDVVRGSKIVNFSLGARRTMTLRTKRAETLESSIAAGAGQESKRETQRIHLAHNSIFVLGEETNRHWLHAIRADKRPESERADEEKEFGGERISLTFRNVGTFIDTREGMIWGQGATGRTKAQAQKLLQGKEAEAKGEEMIIGFGKENHLSTSWDWATVYGQGFDVVNFETKKA